MVVKVRRERPDQRRHHRLTAPLYVTIGPHTLRAADWSLGGLRLEGYPDRIPELGEAVEMNIALPYQSFAISFEARGEIVRRDPRTGMFALKFTELGERELRILEHFVEELVRGSMTDIEDTIQRIDVPVTPVSTKPDVNPGKAVPIERWPIRTIAYTSFYALLGIFVFGYAALLAYSNFFRMEIESAVITAPVEAVRAEGDGRVAWTVYQPGDVVPKGAVVVQLVDNQLQREIDIASIAIDEKKARLVLLKRQQVEELSRLEGYATIERRNLDQARLETEALEEAAKAAAEQYARVQKLFKKGFATRKTLEEARRDAVAARSRLESQQVEWRSRAELAAQNLGERHWTGTDIVGDRARLEAEIRFAEQEISAAERTHAALIDQRQRLAAVAPFDGLILEMPRVDGGHVQRGDVIAILEQPRSRRVTAYLTQDEVLKIGLGDETLVYVPSVADTLSARVVAIDRTSGFVDEQNQTYSWRGRKDRTAKVTLEFEDERPLDAKDSYRSGTPVVVIFGRRSTNQLVSSVGQAIGLLPGASAPDRRLAEDGPAGGTPAARRTDATLRPGFTPAADLGEQS
ncbi:MAG: HlyD family efflux transporter periplasmic adaptor subunit [Hyphomicrobiaceae bacterium]